LAALHVSIFAFLSLAMACAFQLPRAVFFWAASRSDCGRKEIPRVVHPLRGGGWAYPGTGDGDFAASRGYSRGRGFGGGLWHDSDLLLNQSDGGIDDLDLLP